MPSALKWTALYVASIALVNWLFGVIPLVDLPTGDKWPPASLIVGLIFVFRDFAQREIGHNVWFAMILGGIISWFMANPFIAVASVIAFAVSEGMDWLIYTLSKRPMRDRILLSSLVSTPVDSAVFLLLIGFFSWPAVIVMTLSKLVGAFAIRAMMRPARG
jgi:hypothetical protein